MLNTLSQLGTDQLDWIKNWLLLPSYVVAAVFVTLGVYLEKKEFEESTHKIGWRMLVGSLGIEIVLTIFIFAVDARISALQRNEIIALQKRLAPRSLTAEQLERLVNALKPFKETLYDFSFWTPESITFMQQLAYLLKDAGWTLVPWTGGGNVWSFSQDVPAGQVPLFGIEVRIFDPALSLAMKTLAAELRSAGIEEVYEVIARAPLPDSPQAHTMHIMIGQKR